MLTFLLINSGKRTSNSVIESRYRFSFAIYRPLKFSLLNNSCAFEEDWDETPVTSFKKPFSMLDLDVDHIDLFTSLL